MLILLSSILCNILALKLNILQLSEILPFYWILINRFVSSFSTACKCNNHTSTCTFSPPVYVSSSNTTGSVCTNCQSNTQGNQCGQCQANYYRQENTTLDSPDVCKSKQSLCLY